METDLGTKPKYVSVKEAAAYFGCSEDAIRSDYTRDPENCKGVIYKGGYRCCLEENTINDTIQHLRRPNDTINHCYSGKS